MPIYLPPISRRKFLAGSLSAAVAAAFGQGCALPVSKTNPHGVALLSDVHIAADPHRIERGVNMTNNLQTVAGEVMAWPERPALAFVNGDLAFNNGEYDDYSAVLKLLRPMREAGMPLYLGMGNHDNREHFWNVMQGTKALRPHLVGRQAAIVRTPEVNWFLLDSLIRTRVTPGLVGETQRAWLAQALDANADKPAIILIHHQPEHAVPNKKGSGLEDTAEVLAILRPRRQVKAYFFGHTHNWNVRQDESGIHLINLPPTAYLFRAGRPNGWVHATVRGDGAQLELRCLNHSHQDQGQIINLDWRSA